MAVTIASQGNALLIDYAWCTGCHSCEMACRKEHGLPDDQYGIKVNKMAWPIDEDTWQFTHLPAPTDQCDGCVDRRAAGKIPTCVHHCQAKCLQFGTFEEMTAAAPADHRFAIFAI